MQPRASTLASLIFVLATCQTIGCESNVQFQSSDGEWADGENLFMGRDFEAVVFEFELFRFNCKSSAELQRTTDRPKWSEIESWFNDYSQPKWKVPYSGEKLTAASYYPPADDRDHCANHGSKREDLERARFAARRFITDLSAQ